MKILYIESKLKNQELNLPSEELAKLPKKLFLAYSLQYKDIAIKIKKLLETNDFTISQFRQVLGCSKLKTKDPVFFMGSGRFHAINIFKQADEVYILENNKISKFPGSEISLIKTKRKTALLKFLSSENIGILVSTKPGQENLKKAEKLKTDLQKKGKNPYIFITNNIDIKEFENFNIGSWVNTACPGLSFDNPEIINIDEIPK